MFFSCKQALSEFIFFKSLQKEARLRASAHQETMLLQNQGVPSAPYQDSSSDEEGEAVENHDQGERRGESGARKWCAMKKHRRHSRLNNFFILNQRPPRSASRN